jgi:uncharacterized small protein (DUF1192 family)
MVAVKKSRRVVAAVIALTAGIAGGALAQSEEETAKVNHDVAVLKSEINRLQQVIGSLDQRIGTLSDTLAAVEARLAETEGRPAPAAASPPAADCGAREHGSVFVGKPVECYYGYRIYQCWNGEIRMVGGECEAATQ